jgi:hypothetical protein
MGPKSSVTRPESILGSEPAGTGTRTIGTRPNARVRNSRYRDQKPQLYKAKPSLPEPETLLGLEPAGGYQTRTLSYVG